MIDLRVAARRLIAVPAFSLAAILTLGLGIGANTFAFSAVQAMLVAPLPIADADRVVWVFAEDRRRGVLGERVNGDEATALARLHSFDTVAVVGARAFVEERGDRRVQWQGLHVTLSLLGLLDVEPVLGRALSVNDMPSGPAPAMMLGYERWQQDFAGDPSVVGRVLHFADRKSFTVVGVLPSGLEFPFDRAPGAGTGVEFAVGVQDFWILGQDAPNGYPGGLMVARLRNGVEPEQAVREAESVARGLRTDAGAGGDGRSFAVVTVRDHALGVLAPALPLLQGFAALVLLIACANVACLQLARALTARTEFAVRTALGARTADLLRGLLAEGLLLAVGAATTGLALAWCGQTLFAIAASDQVPLAGQVGMDSTVLLFTLALCVATAVGCALVPAAVARRAPASALMDSGGRGQTAGRSYGRVLRGIVVAQVAVTLVLLTGAALVFQSLTRLMAVDTGYEPGPVLAADVLLFEPPSQFMPFFLRLHARLRTLPGVEAVGLIQSTPLTGKWTFREELTLPGSSAVQGRVLDLPGSFVAFDYFAAMGIPVLAGRAFTEREFTSSNRVIIINDVAAQMFFPGQPAVGRHLVMAGSPREIVGVVKGTRDVRLDTPAEPQWYQAAFVGGSQIIVRTSTPPEQFVGTLRQELIASDPRLIIKRIDTLDAIVAASTFERRIATQLLSVFAGLAFTLALVGLYGVLSFMTIQRRRELGVRAALGAQRRDLVGIVVRQGLGMTAAGVLLGTCLAWPLRAATASLLFGVDPSDPWTIAGASLSLIVAAGCACAVPAWRAATVNPASIARLS